MQGLGAHGPLTSPFYLPSLVHDLSFVPRGATQCCQYCCLSVLLLAQVSTSLGAEGMRGGAGSKMS